MRTLADTFNRSLAKSWPSFSWSKLAMNCWQDIFLPMFCHGKMVLPESREEGWCGPYPLPCPVRQDEAVLRAVMKVKLPGYSFISKNLQNIFAFKSLFNPQTA